MNIGDYSPSDRETARILNALWEVLYPDNGSRPLGWHPSRDLVSRVDLHLLPGIGWRSRAIIANWLKE